MINIEVHERFNECKKLAEGPFNTEEQLAEAFYKSYYMYRFYKEMEQNYSELLEILNDPAHRDHKYWKKLVDKQVLNFPDLEFYDLRKQEFQEILIKLHEHIVEMTDGESELYYHSSFSMIIQFSLMQDEGKTFQMLKLLYENAKLSFGVRGMMELLDEFIHTIKRHQISSNLKVKFFNFLSEIDEPPLSNPLTAYENRMMMRFQEKLANLGEIVYNELGNEEQYWYYIGLQKQLDKKIHDSEKNIAPQVKQRFRKRSKETPIVWEIMRGQYYKELSEDPWQTKPHISLDSFCERNCLFLEIKHKLSSLIASICFGPRREIQEDDINSITENIYIREKIVADLDRLVDEDVLKKQPASQSSYNWKHTERLQGLLYFVEYRLKELMYKGQSSMAITIKGKKLPISPSTLYQRLLRVKTNDFSVDFLHNFHNNPFEMQLIIDHLCEHGIIEQVVKEQMAYSIEDFDKLREIFTV